MALTFDICTKGNETAGYSGQGKPDELKQSYGVQYQVEISDPADPDFDPMDVDVFTVLRHSSLPVVNQSCYVARDGQSFYPYVICRSKNARRDDNRRSRFLVDVKYETGNRNDNQEEDLQGLYSSIDQIPARIELTVGEKQRVIYEDKSSTPLLLMTPTKNYYEEPFMETRGTQQRRVSQYESFISYDDMVARSFKTNSDAYATKAIGSWLMGAVEASEVTVPLVGGPVVAALVTYPMEWSPYEWGWKDRRALIDTHYLEATSPPFYIQKVPFYTKERQSRTTGYIDSDGLKRGSQDGTPDYEDFMVYEEQAFNTFLKA